MLGSPSYQREAKNSSFRTPPGGSQQTRAQSHRQPPPSPPCFYVICASFMTRLLPLPCVGYAYVQRETPTNKETVTPGRSRLSAFLGNATPSRLRRLAGRMSTKSPGISGSQRSSSRHSRSGSSTRSRKHRRQGTYPGAYSQRNSSELDHQRPPADPVYTFMIKVLCCAALCH